MEGLWLAASIRYADVTEEGVIQAGLALGMGTFGAVRLEDLRQMSVMTYIRTVKEYEKMAKERADASSVK